MLSVGVECQLEDLYPLISQQNYVPVVDDQNVFIGIVRRQSVVSSLVRDK
jgi:hypothetical protein